jgi:hypothetical protein
VNVEGSGILFLIISEISAGEKPSPKWRGGGIRGVGGAGGRPGGDGGAEGVGGG